MILLQVKELKELGTTIFVSQGAPRDKAEFVAETLVEACLTGHDSHGVLYFPLYSEQIKKGYIDVRAEPVVMKESSTTALVDGRWAFGQVTAMQVMKLAVDKAKENMISGVGAYNCNHIGRLGYYTAWAARQGVLGMMFVNVGNQAVSIFRGIDAVFGTNPFSASAPTSEREPFLLDYATSVVAGGKVSVASTKHEKIPRHWIRDKEGRVTDNPDDLWDGGWLLPFGEHKGYCFQLLMELLGAVMTGSRLGFEQTKEPPSPNGVFAIAIDPEGFIGRETFQKRSETLFRVVRATTPQAGNKILIPGEPEWESRKRRLREGIPITEETWEQIVRLSEEHGIALGNYMNR